MGKLATPGFLMGFLGIEIGTFFMWLMGRSGSFGLMGISMTGAVINNSVQLAIAAWFIVKSVAIMYLYPYFVVIGTISAIANAILAYIVLKRIGEFL